MVCGSAVFLWVFYVLSTLLGLMVVCYLLLYLACGLLVVCCVCDVVCCVGHFRLFGS